MKNTTKGFTLIELLVVVLIIGILSSIALPQYQKAVEKSRAVQAVTLARTLQTALDEVIMAGGIPESSGTHCAMRESSSITVPSDGTAAGRFSGPCASKSGRIGKDFGYFDYCTVSSTKTDCTIVIYRTKDATSSSDAQFWRLYLSRNVTSDTWSMEYTYYSGPNLKKDFEAWGYTTY